MKRIKILKQGVVTNQAEGIDAEMDAWLASCLAKNKFGKPERWTPEALCTPDELAKSLGTREVDGPIGSDAKVIEHHLPAEFTVVEEDMTAEIAEKEAKEKAKKDLHDELKQLKRGDLKDVAHCADAIMKILKHLGVE